MKTRRVLLLLLALLLILTLSACVQGLLDRSPDERPSNEEQRAEEPRKKAALPASQLPPIDAKRIIEERATEALKIIKERDFAALAERVHPSGVRFSPYSYVDVSENGDLVFSPEQVRAFEEDDTTYTWGHYDGTGFPIELTPREYFDEFVYTADFINAENVSYNETLGVGNTLENQFEVYPDAIIVEYHFSGLDPQYGGMDWQSLRLAFEELEGDWYLVGVIHNQWTI
ncbi:MAG: hypothetical protein GX047_02240 [Firmicutes bacterium]|nr:hypothetical protein [Bacillota bacterium]